LKRVVSYPLSALLPTEGGRGQRVKVDDLRGLDMGVLIASQAQD